MCGRYASAKDPAALVEEFDVDTPPSADLPPRYNVAPTQDVYVVRQKADDDAHLHRVLDIARWGLVPSWAKDPSIGNRMINARAETVGDKPAYRRAFAKRRCILPADGFYEWQAPADAGPKPRKQPYFLRPADGSSLAMAGLYEWWRDPADPNAPWLMTTVILTTEAVDDVGRIHERMPVIVVPEERQAWLDPETPGSDVLPALLAPAPSGFWDIYPVSTAVNNVRNDGPGLLDRVEI